MSAEGLCQIENCADTSIVNMLICMVTGWHIVCLTHKNISMHARYSAALPSGPIACMLHKSCMHMLVATGVFVNADPACMLELVRNSN